MLYAGAAVRDISPQRPMALYGYPHVERTSTGVHDPLLATVVVLRNSAAMLVLGSLDLLMIEPLYARQLRKCVAAAVGCEESAVLVSCTHTHSGPVTSRLIGWQKDPAVPSPDPRYLEFVQAELTDAAVEAAESVGPAELAWASGDATGVGGNRLSKEGVTDPECGLLAVRGSLHHDLLAMALIYAMHPTVLHEDSTLVSADFPYFTRVQIQEHVGREIPIAYHMAPCGNQSPRRFVTEQTFTEAERLGRKLGRAVCRALDQLTVDSWQADAQLGARLATVDLPRKPLRSLPEAERLLAEYQARHAQLQRTGAARAAVRTAQCAVFGAEGTVALAEAQMRGELEVRLRDYCPAEVQTLQIGQACLVGLPGECFTEYGLEIKRRAQRPTFVVSLVNGELQGYVVTPEGAASGGYEATNAVFAPEAGRVLVAAAVAMVTELDGA
jgi:neutral ceramidase